MNLAQIVAADLATQRQYALVFGEQLAQSLAQKWQQYGSTNCVPAPLRLVTGNWMLCADILSEVVEGRLLHAMWANSDLAAIEAGVAVVPLADALALLPPDPVV